MIFVLNYKYLMPCDKMKSSRLLLTHPLIENSVSNCDSSTVALLVSGNELEMVVWLAIIEDPLVKS